MRRTLKLLLLLGVGLLMVKPNGDGPDGDGFDGGDVDPITGRPKDSEERQERLNFQGKDASTQMPEVHAIAKKNAEQGTPGGSQSEDTTETNTPDQESPVKPTGDLEADFDALPSGKNKHVKTVESEAELREFFDSWTEGATQVPGSPPKITDRFKLPDGTMVQWRTASASGGATIDIVTPGTKMRKVHLD